LLAAYRKQHADQPQKTHDKRAAKLRDFAAVAGHTDASAVTRAEVSRWKTVGLDAGKSAKTVNDGIIMLRPMWFWAMREGRLPNGDNPFSNMALKATKRGGAKRKGFSDEEAVTLLQAARRETGFLRWVPWVRAWTGCRLEEACARTCGRSATCGAWTSTLAGRMAA
jgi:integrase